MPHYLQRQPQPRLSVPCANLRCGNEVTFERPLPPTGFSFKTAGVLDIHQIRKIAEITSYNFYILLKDRSNPWL